MKVKIRCDSCARQIAVDEAFVGGVCRCPFCKALVAVDGSLLGGREGTRPEAPGLETPRPEAPARESARAAAPATPTPARGGRPDDLAVRAARQKDVPTASPVKVVNVVAIVMAVVLAAMIAVALVLAVRAGLFRPKEKETPTPPAAVRAAPKPSTVAPAMTAPATGPVEPQPKGPATVGGDLTIEAPVVYCLELGPGRIGQRSGVVALAGESVRTLGPARKFDIAACSGGAVQWLGGKTFRPGGKYAADKLEGFFAGLGASGAAPVAKAFADALAVAPRTVVVLAWSKVQADEAADKAKKQGVKVVVVCVAGTDTAAASLEALAGRCGGVFRRMTPEQVDAFGEALEKARARREGP